MIHNKSGSINKYDYQRSIEINKKNDNLVQKIINISDYKRQFIFNDSSSKDRKNTYFVQSQKSLNKNQRQKDNLNVVIQNQKILERIKNQKSYLVQQKWQSHRDRNEKHIQSTCLFAPSTIMDSSRQKSRQNHSIQNRNKSSLINLAQYAKQHIQKENKQILKEKILKNIQNRITIYKQSRRLDDEVFFIMMYISKGIFHINLEGSRLDICYQLELKEKAALKMLADCFQNNIEEFIKFIKFNGSTYQIKGTNYLFQKNSEYFNQTFYQQQNKQKEQLVLQKECLQQLGNQIKQHQDLLNQQTQQIKQQQILMQKQTKKSDSINSLVKSNSQQHL